MNQTPRPISIHPPQRLTTGAPARIRSVTASWATATVVVAANASPTITAAATANATRAAENPPTVSDCPARPARIGPVHPKPMKT